MPSSQQFALKQLSEDAFRPFGRILEPTDVEEPNVETAGSFRFFVLLSVRSTGWQIGYLTVSADAIDVIECHPTTPEVFVPLQGESILIVSIDSKELVGFPLTRPVVLHQGIWHGVLRSSQKPTVLIAESSGVTDEFVALEKALTVPNR